MTVIDMNDGAIFSQETYGSKSWNTPKSFYPWLRWKSQSFDLEFQPLSNILSPFPVFPFTLQCLMKQLCRVNNLLKHQKGEEEGRREKDKIKEEVESREWVGEHGMREWEAKLLYVAQKWVRMKKMMVEVWKWKEITCVFEERQKWGSKVMRNEVLGLMDLYCWEGDEGLGGRKEGIMKTGR